MGSLSRLIGCGVILCSLFCSCSDNKSTEPTRPSAPTVSTAAVGAITETDAAAGGTVTSDGGAPVTARGVCYCTDVDPTLDDDITTDGAGTGAFTSSMTGLTAGTTYHVRAYATNSAGTGYGEVREFTTTAAVMTVTDIDGNVYETVTIGTQVWMAENLKVTHYRNGDPIPYVTDGFQWDALTSGSYCNYNLSEDTAAIYGRLYNWFAVDDSRNIAPEGWHVPTDSEWGALRSFMGQNPGGGLKDTGTTYWLSPNEGATNATGFSALPGGERGYQGQFGAIGQEAYFWTSSSYNTDRADIYSLSAYDANIYRRFLSKVAGHSVRCVKD